MLEEKIYQDYIQALKSRDKHKTDFFSFVRAELKNVAINLKKDKLEDNDALVVINKLKKRLEETKESSLAAGKTDALEQVERELAILNGYLPQPLSEEELTETVNQVISELQVKLPKEMGRVMKEILSKYGTRVDAKKASELVKNKLSPG